MKILLISKRGVIIQIYHCIAKMSMNWQILSTTPFKSLTWSVSACAVTMIIWYDIKHPIRIISKFDHLENRRTDISILIQKPILAPFITKHTFKILHIRRSGSELALLPRFDTLVEWRRDSNDNGIVDDILRHAATPH